MFLELKSLTPEAVPAAISKAERYRLLNEPAEAGSICLDVLRIEPENQAALIVLLLALTEQFDDEAGVNEARDLLPRLKGEYERAYYAGIISERRGKALFKRGGPGSGVSAYRCFRDAMGCYEEAESLRPAGNDDAVLRWNTCARFLMRHPHLEPAPEETTEVLLLE